MSPVAASRASLFADADLGAGLAFDGLRPDEADAGAGAAKDAGDGAVRRAGPDGVVLADLDAAILVEFAEGARKSAYCGVVTPSLRPAPSA